TVKSSPLIIWSPPYKSFTFDPLHCLDNISNSEKYRITIPSPLSNSHTQDRGDHSDFFKKINNNKIKFLAIQTIS
ncbi:hypothetical protein PJI17_32250, partial [Mycobacterium kansasii]